MISLTNIISTTKTHHIRIQISLPITEEEEEEEIKLSIDDKIKI
jgi:hypothetical protein